jgi:hypothetical protein
MPKAAYVPGPGTFCLTAIFSGSMNEHWKILSREIHEKDMIEEKLLLHVP